MPRRDAFCHAEDDGIRKFATLANSKKNWRQTKKKLLREGKEKRIPSTDERMALRTRASSRKAEDLQEETVDEVLCGSPAEEGADDDESGPEEESNVKSRAAAKQETKKKREAERMWVLFLI